MIRANELRLGNLVYNQGIIDDVKMFQVIKDREDYEPIPLTPEILEAAGMYEEDGYIHKSGEYWFRLVTDDDKFFYYYTEFKRYHINSLHQLQNLYFALTGTELEMICNIKSAVEK